jgi:hypothetical protein
MPAGYAGLRGDLKQLHVLKINQDKLIKKTSRSKLLGNALIGRIVPRDFHPSSLTLTLSSLISRHSLRKCEDMPKIELYAELLTYIRTVTIVASLQTETDDETRIELLSDNQTITISHHGVSASLRLPTRMIGGGTAAITLPPRPSKDLTLRLKVEETAPGFLSLEHSDENIVPWPANALHDAKGLQCKECAASIVDVDQIHEWRDLPNENWAEMMDFWHCHKPHEHEHEGLEHDQGKKTAAVDGKGYSASNKLSAQPGIGYIGLSYFLLAEEDCRNVKVSLAA